ncbi:MAG: nucleotidyltransferase domain-containing protein [Candidatus Rokuibacteriota bacterium]
MQHGVSGVSERLRTAADSYARSLGRRLGDNLVSVVLYGSVARGEARDGSDIDLLVVCDDLPDGRFARLRRLEGAEHDLDPELARLRADGIDTRLAVIARTRSEAERTVPLYLDMVEDARLLFDREGFFAAILDRLRARLVALGAQRRRLGRARYWILKRDFVPGEVVEL